MNQMWVLVIYVVLNVAVLLYYWRHPKVLTPYQTVGCWLLIIFFREEWLYIACNNLKLIETTPIRALGLTLLLNRVLLYPLLGIFCLEYYVRQRSWAQKIQAFLFTLFGMLVLEYFNEWMGLYRPLAWRFWWSVLLWAAFSGMLVVAQSIFRKLAAKT